jgi:hypothetical protein
VATITPIVTSMSPTLAGNAATMTINGFGFSPTAASNIVSFNGQAAGTLSVGSLTASVSVGAGSSGGKVQVATVIPGITPAASNSVLASAATITINGGGFNATPGSNTVAFQVRSTTGVVSSATVTGIANSGTTKSLTVGVSGLVAGDLYAEVTNGVSSGSWVQVATVSPVVTLLSNGSMPSVSASAVAAGTQPAIVVTGAGFDTTDTATVKWNQTGTGTFTPTQTTTVVSGTSIHIGLATTAGLSHAAGAKLYAEVTVNGVTSSAVEIATVGT